MLLAQNIKQSSLLDSANLNEFWTKFHSSILEYFDNIENLKLWSNFAMPVLHRRLASNSVYQDALKRAKNEPFESYNLSIPLIDDGVTRLNLIAIEAGGGLPLHDHPDSAGLALVISGDVDITLCEYSTTSDSSSNSSSVLTVVENKIFSPGETSCFTQEQCNIHGMDAVSERCVLLVIHASAFETNLQSFFFPSSPQKKAGSQVLTQRVRAQAIHNFRRNKAQHNIKGIKK